MESHEVVLDGETYQVKPIRNLNGHSIGPYSKYLKNKYNTEFFCETIFSRVIKSTLTGIDRVAHT